MGLSMDHEAAGAPGGSGGGGGRNVAVPFTVCQAGFEGFREEWGDLY